MAGKLELRIGLYDDQGCAWEETGSFDDQDVTTDAEIQALLKDVACFFIARAPELLKQASPVPLNPRWITNLDPGGVGRVFARGSGQQQEVANG